MTDKNIPETLRVPHQQPSVADPSQTVPAETTTLLHELIDAEAVKKDSKVDQYFEVEEKTQ